VALSCGSTFALELPQEHAAFLYTFEGSIGVEAAPESAPVRTHELAVLSAGAQLRLTGLGEGTSRAIVVAGRPLREPVAKYGPFVMNTRAELEQAFADFQAGRF